MVSFLVLETRLAGFGDTVTDDAFPVKPLTLKVQQKEVIERGKNNKSKYD